MTRKATWLAGAFLATVCTGQAMAQSVDDNLITPNLPIEFDRGRNTGVLQRERPEYQALGVRLSGFTLYPKVEGGVGYSSNAYQISSNQISDGFIIISPSVTANSNWSVHDLNLDASYRAKRYFSETPRDEDNFSIGANGRLDVTRDWSIGTRLRTARAAEPRASAASPQDAIAAVQYNQTSGGIDTNYTGAKLRAQFAANYDTLSFSDVRTFAGTTLRQNNRDQTLLRGTARGEYAISPDTSLFAQFGYTDTRYDQQLSPGVSNRDSDEKTVVAGATFDLSALIRGAVSVGYIKRNYDAPIYKDLSGVAVDAKVEYFFSPLTTIGLSARRSIQDSYFFNSSGYFSTAGAVRVDHELLRNLLLNAQVAYEVDDFVQNAGSIKIFRVSGGARYLLNREFGFGFLIGHDNRSGSGAVRVNTFNETRALFSVIVQR